MNRWQLLQRLLQILRPLKGVMAISMTARVLNLLSGASLLAMGSYVIGRALIAQYLPLPFVILGLVLLSLLKGLFRYLEQFTGHYVAFHLLAELRHRFFIALEPQAPAGLVQLRSGDAVSRVTADVDRIEPFYAHTIAPFFAAVVTPSILLIALAVFDPILALALLPFLLTVGMLIPWLVSRFNHAASNNARNAAGEVNAILTDSLQGIRDVLAFNYGARRQNLLRLAGLRLRQSQAQLANIGAVQFGITEAVITAGMLTLLAVSGAFVQQGVLSIAEVPVIAALSWMAFQPLLGVTGVINDFNIAMVSAERLFAWMDKPPVVRDTGTANAPILTSNIHVRFEDVTFSYNPETTAASNNHVLQGINFDLPFGHTVAIVGASGSGKSTLVSLLLRFWDVDSGRITMNGKDIRQFPLDHLRDCISVVSQQTYIFNSSVRENIRIGNPTASDEEVVQAARRAQLHDFIQTLPNGYDTQAGEMGSRFSGGQRQRLALARALLKNAPILVLDEATANLDIHTERQVQTAIEENMRGKTTLIIAHRLSTVQHADEILVLEDGKIVERGRHNDLLARKGTYAHLFSFQQDLWESVQVERVTT